MWAAMGIKKKKMLLLTAPLLDFQVMPALRCWFDVIHHDQFSWVWLTMSSVYFQVNAIKDFVTVVSLNLGIYLFIYFQQLGISVGLQEMSTVMKKFIEKVQEANLGHLLQTKNLSSPRVSPNCLTISDFFSLLSFWADLREWEMVLDHFPISLLMTQHLLHTIVLE